MTCPSSFTLDDITLGGWERSEVPSFFDRFDLNTMRARIDKLMVDGLLGDPAGVNAGSVDADVAAPRPRPSY